MVSEHDFVLIALNKVARTHRFEMLNDNVITIWGSKPGFLGDEKICLTIKQSATDPILYALVTADVNGSKKSNEMLKETLFKILDKTEMLDDRLFDKLKIVLYQNESSLNSLFQKAKKIDPLIKKPEFTPLIMDPGKELYSLRISLKRLKNIEQLEPNFWNLQSNFCFQRTLNWFNKGDYETARDLILDLLDVRPNLVEAYYYLARCYNMLNNSIERDMIYQEILEWAMGDWNSFADAIEENDNDKAREYLNLCIKKLSFFIEYVEEFFHAYKMRAKCYRALNDFEKEKRDLDKFREKTQSYGVNFIPIWASKYNII
jgi:tetratricopeptide (TPR) repeat protein